MFSSLLILSSGIYVTVSNSQKVNIRDNQREQTLKNTNKLIDDLNSGVSKIEDKLLRIDSLNYKLDSLERNTMVSITKRNDLLNEFDKFNTQLERLNTSQDSKLKDGIPNVNILSRPEWVKDKGYYYINVRFNNNGQRFAKDFKVTVLFMKTSDDGKILKSKFITNEYTELKIFHLLLKPAGN